MVGDYHLELVVGRDQIELYLSDAYRRPLRPEGASLDFDDGEQVELAWRRGRLVGRRPAGLGPEAQCTVRLVDTTVLSMSFVFDDTLSGSRGRVR